MFFFLFFPIYWAVSTSLRETAEIQKRSVSIVQKTFTLEHYQEALTGVNLLSSIKNSLILTVVTVVVTILVGFLMGYAFSKLHFKGKNMINSMILLTQFIPMVSVVSDHGKDASFEYTVVSDDHLHRLLLPHGRCAFNQLYP